MQGGVHGTAHCENNGMNEEMAKPTTAREGAARAGEPSEQARHLNEARFQAFINASSDVIFRASPDWTEMARLGGRDGMVGAQAAHSNWLEAFIHPDDRQGVAAAIERAIATRDTFQHEHRVWRADGSVGWTLMRAVPVFDSAGEIIEWFGTASDVTAGHRTQEDLARVTANAEEQRKFYELLISTTPDLIYAFDRERRFIFANQALLEMWGRSLESSIGKSLIEVGYEPWHAEMHEREIDRVLASRQGIRGEVGFPHATLGRRTYDYIFTPVLDAAGEVVSIAGSTRDITEIKRAEEHLQLLVNELNHRVMNTLSTVQSIAMQTFRGGGAEPRASAAFEARLVALSDAHTILTRTNWEGASLRDIALRALAPFAADGDPSSRVSLEGDDVQLRPQPALALAMALHELATNASRYGALSNENGRIGLHWLRESDRLRLTWREEGGPRVEQPTSRGFGSRLLERGLGYELNGTVSLDYRPDGVVCTIEARMAKEPADART